eukprot:6136276-Lingulodinium_polyedra.AAC.1
MARVWCMRLRIARARARARNAAAYREPCRRAAVQGCCATTWLNARRGIARVCVRYANAYAVRAPGVARAR